MLFVFKMVLILRSLKCFNNKICSSTVISSRLDSLQSKCVVAVDNIKGHCCYIYGSSPKCFLHFVVWILWCCCWTIVRLLVEYQYKIHIRLHCSAISQGRWGELWRLNIPGNKTNITNIVRRGRARFGWWALPEKCRESLPGIIK